MRYDSEHKARTHERLLREAAAAIRAEGADRVGVAAIMARANLTQGGFYAHFKSKDDLIAQAITYMFDRSYTNFLERHKDSPDPKKVLGDFIDRYLAIKHCVEPDQGCPVAALAGDVRHMSKKPQERFAEGVARFTKYLGLLLARAGVEDAQQQAHSVLAELVGAICLARAVKSRSSAATILSDSQQAMKKRLGLRHAIED